MTKAKPKIVHLSVTPEMHKDLLSALARFRETAPGAPLSQCARWILRIGLESYNATPRVRS
jgi:hypothetical protein